MADRRLIVIPKTQPRGLLSAVALAGVTHGLLLWAVWDRLIDALLQLNAPGGIGMWRLLYIAALLLAIFPMLVLVRLIVRTRKSWLESFACGPVYCAAGVSAVILAIYLSEPGGPQWLRRPEVLMNVMVVAISLGTALVVGLVVFPGGFAVMRFFTPSLVEQTGQLCWKCAYDLGSNRVTTCPECGTPAEPSRFRAAWLVVGVQGALRFARPVLGVGLTAAFAATLFVFVSQTWPPFSLLRGFRAQAGAREIMSMCTKIEPRGATVLLSTSPKGDRGMAVHICCCADKPRIASRLQIVTLADRSAAADDESVEDGSAIIFADLTWPQARQAARTGVPQALIDRLYAEADRVEWRQHE